MQRLTPFIIILAFCPFFANNHGGAVYRHQKLLEYIKTNDILPNTTNERHTTTCFKSNKGYEPSFRLPQK